MENDHVWTPHGYYFKKRKHKNVSGVIGNRIKTYFDTDNDNYKFLKWWFLIKRNYLEFFDDIQEQEFEFLLHVHAIGIFNIEYANEYPWVGNAKGKWHVKNLLEKEYLDYFYTDKRYESYYYQLHYSVEMDIKRMYRKLFGVEGIDNAPDLLKEDNNWRIQRLEFNAEIRESRKNQ